MIKKSVYFFGIVFGIEKEKEEKKWEDQKEERIKSGVKKRN